MGEGFFVLIGSVLGLWVLISPIVSIVSFVRGQRLRQTVDELERTIHTLDARIEAMARAQARLRAAPPAEGPAAEMPTAPRIQAPPVPPTTAPAVPPAVPVAAASDLPQGAAPAAAPPLAPIADPAPAAATPPPLPAAASAPRRAAWPPPPPDPARPDGPRPPVRPPFSPPPPQEPTTPAVAFDWESMLGVRGAAWLAGITFAVAAIYLAKLSIDHGFFTPLLRVLLLIVTGTAALAWAEIGLRRGYEPTADAISGAGIVTLYVAWFAAHSLYGLIELTPAFAAMSAVTAIAAVISVRHGALFTAILGLVGGLATPLLLSSGQDHPVGLFTYLGLLNLGFLFVARRQKWAVITGLALGGTTLLQLGWLGQPGRLREETLPIAIAAFAGLGGLYLWHALATDSDDEPTSHVLGLIGSAVPLVVSIGFAVDPRFAPLWPLVLGNIVLLDVAAVAAGVWRLRSLVVTSAITTAIACAFWAIHADSTLSPAGPALVVLGLTAGYNLLGRLFPGPAPEDGGRPVLSLFGASGLVVAGGLYVFTAVVLLQVVPPPALVLAVTALLFLVLVERTTVDVAPLVLPAGAVLLAILAREWFEVAAVPGGYVGLLAFAHLLAAAFAAVAIVRDRLGAEADAPWYLRSDLAVVAALVVAYAGLHAAMAQGAYAGPGPLFGLLLIGLALTILVAVRRAWTALVPMAAAAAWFFATSWHVQRFTPVNAPTAVGAEIVIYLTFVLLPFILNAIRPEVWRFAIGSWLTSAMIGPAFFVIFRAAWVELWGTSSIGALAVILAAVTVGSLAGVGRVFRADDGDPRSAARRLNYLALFAAIALGFVATAIAMQLDRQWITIGWALEAAAVFWVFGLVPHPGLKYLGLLLFGAVGVRLLANPEVLRYEPRGQPIVNWLLYTYGVPVLCTFAGAWFLRRAEAARADADEYDWAAGDRSLIVPMVGGLGLILLFWLINLEIADYFSAGRYIEIDFSRRLERDLTRSCAWILYSLALLGIGLWRDNKGVRIASLVFLMLTVGKVFLYDLSALTGIYRVLSFVALGTSLVIFSLLFQRFGGRRKT